MSLFEFTFGLHSLLVGLGLAQMASSVQGLAIAGRRVRWAIEPVLMAAVFGLLLVVVWLESWPNRDMTRVAFFPLAAHLSEVLLAYIAAGSVLPQVSGSPADDSRIDLLDWFRRTRFVSLGAMAAAVAGDVLRHWMLDGDFYWKSLVIVGALLAASVKAPRWLTIILLSLLLASVVAVLVDYQLQT